MRNNNLLSRNEGGFTLIEIMIALLVFTVIMLGVAGGLITVVSTNKGNVVRDEALRIAEEELNRLRGEQFTTTSTSADLTANEPAWTAPTNVQGNIRGTTTTFARATQISDMATAATALKRIDVAVGWNDPNNPGAAVLAATGMNRQLVVSTIIVRSD
ncbi:MAG: prepilin-type N-terminal cleavage/methylation domain-containing protein [Thermodesulfobacteriota bacterium]